MNPREVIFIYHLNGFLLIKLPELLEVIITKFIDNLSEVRLNLQPLEKLNDHHG